MKKRTIIAALMLLAGVSFAQSGTTNLAFNLDQAIPEGNPVGLTVTTNLTGMAGAISLVTVNLDITGGFNGDLYAYLVGPNGGFAVLLNRTGVTTGNAFGYSDAGFNITLDDSGANNNIHFYQNYSYTLSGGQLTDTWSSDGENVDPLGNLVGLASPTATLLSLNGTNPNGTWTFFIADMSGGSQAILDNFALNITTVPEPQTWIFCLAGLPALLWLRRWKCRPAKTAIK